MLNEFEVQALEAILAEAIVKSEEEDDGTPVFHEVNVEGVNPFGDKAVLDAVYVSLEEKGLIECSLLDELGASKPEEFVCITPKGLDALKCARGVH